MDKKKEDLEHQIWKLQQERDSYLRELSTNRLSRNPNIADLLDDITDAKFKNDMNRFKTLVLSLSDVVSTDYSVDLQHDPIADIQKFYSSTPYYELPGRLGVKLRLKLGNTLVIGARPGVGKTKTMANLIYEDLKELVPIVVFSLEQDQVDIWISIAQLWIKENYDISVSFWKMASIMNSKEYENIRLAFNAWVEGRKSTVRIVDASGYSATDIVRSVEVVSQKLQAKPEKVYVDYLQIINREQGFRGNSKESMDMTSKILTTKIKRMRSIGIFLSQLSRESSKEKRPSSSDFKESGAIEQDAGAAIILERPLDDNGKPSNDLEVWIVKDRYGGKLGRTPCLIDPSTYYITANKGF